MHLISSWIIRYQNFLQELTELRFLVKLLQLISNYFWYRFRNGLKFDIFECIACSFDKTKGA